MTTQSPTIPYPATQALNSDSSRRNVYYLGGASALAIGALLIVEMIAYLATAAPSLTDAVGWFSFFQTNRLAGLIDFGALELLALVLFVPVFFALYTALRRASENALALAMLLAAVGIAANFATCRLFPLLTLSDLYAAAPAAQKAQFLPAGQAILALGALGGIGGSVEGGIPSAVAGLIVCGVMLRSHSLGKAAACAGLLANGVGLLMYLRAALVPAGIGSPLFLPFFLLSVAWFVLIALGLFRAGREA